jgi:hypothetical protein
MINWSNKDKDDAMRLLIGQRDQLKAQVAKLEAIVEVEQGRVKELKAERDRAVERHGDGIETRIAVQKTLDERTHELAECRAMNAALVAASASGQGMTWGKLDIYITVYSSVEMFNGSMDTVDESLEWNYHPHSWKMLDDGRIAVMWQRPARTESEGSE